MLQILLSSKKLCPKGHPRNTSSQFHEVSLHSRIINVSNVKIVSLDFSGNSNDWKIVINNKAIHDEVFFSPLSKKLHCSTALITCWTSSSSVWRKLFVRQNAKKFHPISASSFAFPFRKCEKNILSNQDIPSSNNVEWVLTGVVWCG